MLEVSGWRVRVILELGRWRGRGLCWRRVGKVGESDFGGGGVGGYVGGGLVEG